MAGRDEATLTLTNQGAGVVTAGDIQLDHDVEIPNPEHVIAHVSEKGSSQHEAAGSSWSWL